MYTNIYNLLESPENEHPAILSELKERLEQRIKQGKKNWLVFFAKYGSPDEKLRFSNENWVFCDVDMNSHDKNDDDRILIALNFDEKKILKKFLATCTSLFEYISFDGSIAGQNITKETLRPLVESLTANGVVATSLTRSNIQDEKPLNNDPSLKFKAGIFYFPTGTVPMGRGTVAPSKPLAKMRSMVWLMNRARTMEVDFPDSIQEIATAIEFDSIPQECFKYLTDWYSNLMRIEPSAECSKYNDLIKAKADEFFPTFLERYEELLEVMREAWYLPTFDAGQAIPLTDVKNYEEQNLVVLIKRG